MRALILAGGSGTRFWPLSRQLRPKQLLALEGERSLLQETVARLQPLVSPADVWVCTTEALAATVREQLPDVPPSQILLEPKGRNTAPAIGWSVRSMLAGSPGADGADGADGGDDTVAVLPADHRVGDAAAFRETLARAASVVRRDGRVMTLGVTPRWAETGYGYLELDPEGGAAGERLVRRFVEKPPAEAAARYAASGHHLWNAGIFVFRGRPFLDLLARLTPELSRGLDAIAAAPNRLAEIYPTLPSESIDTAVMEKLDDLLTLPLDCGWSDLGSWEALAEVLPQDAAGNGTRGDVLALDARGNLLFADAGTIAVLGVEDLVVVRTGDAVLVLPKGRSQEVKELVAKLTAGGRTDLL